MLLMVFILFGCKQASENPVPENSAPDKGLSDYEFIGDGYEGVFTTPSADISVPEDTVIYNPYVPDLSTIKYDELIYVSPEGTGSGKTEDSPTNFKDALEMTKGRSRSTIIALDGVYSFEIFVDELVNVNIISKNKYGAKIIPVGDNGDDAAFRFYNDCNVHHVSFIGFEVSGGRSLIFNPGTSSQGEAHHIYIAEMKFHDMVLPVYSGLHSYDWTIDRCYFYDSRASYLWYMMGFHHTVMNCVMYNNTYLSVSLRGHYPLDEDYIWNGQNPFIKDREKKYLKANDWTHLIVNNTFASCSNNSRPHDALLGLFYDIVPGEEDESEACYFPPQNVAIVNNIFIDRGVQKKKGIAIWARRGINTGAVNSVDGIFIWNNCTEKSVLVIPGDGSDVSGVKNDKGNFLNVANFGFVDEGNYDFHLTRLSSSLINSGAVKFYYPNTDFDGKKRDGSPDIGAFEF
jgi:hypothetical protein